MKILFLFFKEDGKSKKWFLAVLIIAPIIILLVTLGIIYDDFYDNLKRYVPYDFWSYIFILLIIGVLWWIVKSDEDSKETGK